MATTSRQIDPGLEQLSLREALQEEPFRFQFFQAVRLLQQLAPDRSAVGDFVPPASEVVRFATRPVLTFPASEVHALELSDDKPARMTVNFMGLTGPAGALPICYTEFILERCQRRDTALADFLDIFNHRLISLFYQAWEKYRFTVSYERGEKDRLSQGLADLIGLGTLGLQRRSEPDVEDESLYYYTGLLGQAPHSAVALEQMLNDYFGVTVSVSQFAGRWYKLDRSNQTCLAEGNTLYESLGVGSVVGDEVWDQQAFVRIKLGPLTLPQYLDFLPGGAAYKALRSIVNFYSGEQLDFEAQLILAKDEVPRCELGELGDTAPQLGWVTWMKSRELGRDPGDTIIAL